MTSETDDHPDLTPPEGWLDLPLGNFLDDVRNNQFATFLRLPALVEVVASVDRLFDEVRLWSPADEPTTAVLSLAVRSQSLFRFAISMTMAGATMEAYPLIRGMLEAAGYAVHLKQRPELRSVWAARADAEDAHKRRAASKAFRHSEVCASIRAISPEAAATYQSFYDTSIDLGAHPNVLGVMAGYSVDATGETTVGQHDILSNDARMIVQNCCWASLVAMQAHTLLQAAIRGEMPPERQARAVRTVNAVFDLARAAERGEQD